MNQQPREASTGAQTWSRRTPDADDHGPHGASGPSLSVHGGAGGIRARFTDIALLGELYGSIGSRLAGYAWKDKLEAADGDLVLSSVLSPATFAAAEEAIISATYGPRGLVSRAVAIEAQSFAFVAVVEFYELADSARREAIEALSYGLGYVVGYNLIPIALAGGALYLTVSAISPAFAAQSRQALVEELEDNPELLQTLVNGGGGLLDGVGAHPVTGPLAELLGLDGFHPTTGAAADDLGDLLFGDYEGGLNTHYAGPHLTHEPPRDLEDLLEDLGATNGTEEAPMPDGTITIQKLTDDDGVRYIVHLPGTDSFTEEGPVRNMGSNLNLISGDDTAYGQAIQQAMQAAGVDPTDPVLLVGHSQGGMQAAALAGDPDFGYHVTDVVTAGSPVATTNIPGHVNVLSLENTGDAVPQLDGEGNPDRLQHTTVTADVHSGNIGANHDIGNVYEPIAAAADQSSDPSVQQSISSLQQHGYLTSDGEAVTSQTFTYQAQNGEQVREADIRNPAQWAKNAMEVVTPVL